MNTIKEIERAVDSLPEKEYAVFRQWFINRDWKKWDDQITDDSGSGKLDFLLQEANQAIKNKNLKNI